MINEHFLKILKHQDKKAHDLFVESLIYSAYVLHTINDIIIGTIENNDNYFLINTKSLKVNIFDTEQQALDKALDFYKSLNSEQSKLNI